MNTILRLFRDPLSEGGAPVIETPVIEKRTAKERKDTADLELPKRKEFKNFEVISFNTITRKREDGTEYSFTMVNITDGTTAKTFATNPAFLAENPCFKEGAICDFTFETAVPGKTFYFDKKKNKVPHTKPAENLRGILPSSTIGLRKSAVAEQDAIAAKNAADFMDVVLVKADGKSPEMLAMLGVMAAAHLGKK